MVNEHSGVNITTTPKTASTCAPSTSGATPSADCFSSVENFVQYLKRNPKTSHIDFAGRHLSVDDRKKVVSVGTSKLMETNSAYPSREAKIRLAKLMSDVTGLPSGVFYDPVSHRGFIAKKLENLRVKISPSKRQYTWKRKSTVNAINSSEVTNETSTSNSLQGCPRGKNGCSLCTGRQATHSRLCKLIDVVNADVLSKEDFVLNAN